MLRKIRKSISSAHLLALAALFVALGGSAYAIGKNTVGSKQLRNGAVKTKKVADAAVTTPKLADNAATGAKVDEASLGKVPSAATADTAGSAVSAESAAEAANAANAANAGTLSGLTVAQVRPTAVGNTSDSSQGLDDSSFEQVLATSISIPAGGADMVVTATAELVNNGGGQAGAQCELRSDGTTISQRNTITMPAGHSKVIALTGFANNLPETGALDPENVAIFCQGSIADDTVFFSNGDLVAERLPVE